MVSFFRRRYTKSALPEPSASADEQSNIKMAPADTKAQPQDAAVARVEEGAVSSATSDVSSSSTETSGSEATPQAAGSTSKGAAAVGNGAASTGICANKLVMIVLTVVAIMLVGGVSYLGMMIYAPDMVPSYLFGGPNKSSAASPPVEEEPLEEKIEKTADDKDGGKEPHVTSGDVEPQQTDYVDSDKQGPKDEDNSNKPETTAEPEPVKTQPDITIKGPEPAGELTGTSADTTEKKDDTDAATDAKPSVEPAAEEEDEDTRQLTQEEIQAAADAVVKSVMEQAVTAATTEPVAEPEQSQGLASRVSNFAARWLSRNKSQAAPAEKEAKPERSTSMRGPRRSRTWMSGSSKNMMQKTLSTEQGSDVEADQQAKGPAPEPDTSDA